MKGFRGTLIFALVVIAVGSYAIWDFKKGQTEEDDKARSAQILGDLKAEEVTAFSFKGTSGGYELKKENSVWRTLTPVADDADADMVLTQIRNLAARSTEVVDLDGAAPDLGKYGLTAPLGEFTIETPAGVTKLQVGSVRSYDQGFYVRKNSENSLYVVAAGLQAEMNKPAPEFRSKKIKVPNGDFVAIRYASNDAKKGGTYDFAKVEGQWSLKQKPKLKIASAAVSDYANLFRHLMADAVAADKKDVASLKEHGFQNPVLTLTLSLLPENADEKTPAQEVKIQFGLKGKDEVYLASSTNEPIYKILRGHFEEFLKTVDDFRDKAYPFAYDQFKPVTVRIKTAAKGEQIFEKTDEAWGDALNPHNKVRQEEIHALLVAFMTLKAEEFIPAGSAKPPTENSFELIAQDGTATFKIAYGGEKKAKSGADAYVVKTSGADELMLVAKSAIDEIAAKPLIQEEPKPEAVPEAKPAAESPAKESSP